MRNNKISVAISLQLLRYVDYYISIVIFTHFWHKIMIVSLFVIN